MQQIDNDLDITNTQDPAVKQRWFALGIYLLYTPVNVPCETWVGSMGRNQFLAPIYEACAETGGSQLTMCTTWYNNNIDYYTPLTKIMIERILNLTPI